MVMSEAKIRTSDITNKILQIERLIQLGQFSLAIEELQKVNKNKPKQEYLYLFCNLARRAGAPLLASQIIAPLFRVDSQLYSPTSAERAAYGACLSTLGANNEAEVIFSNSADKTHPDLLIQQAFNFIRLWDYKSAIPLLRCYVELKQISDYQRLIAKVNLLAAYLAEDKYTAFTLEFNSCLKLAQTQKAYLLLANCLEMRAQKHLAQKKWAAAEDDLKLAKQLAKDPDSVYSFYIKKWELFAWSDQNLALDSNSKTEVLNKKLYQLKVECRKKQFWEVERDCDFQFAIRDPKHTTLNKVYFGTPFESYRKKIRRKINESISIPENWDYSHTEVIGNVFIIEPNDLRKIPFRLFATLFRDLYKPLSIGLVQSLLFPEEVFSPESTSKRVNQLCIRLRKLLKLKHAEFDIHVLNHMYQAGLKQQAIRLFSPDQALQKVFDSAENQLEKDILSGRWGQRFILHDIHTDLPEYVLRRVLKKIMAEKKLQYVSQGPKSFYYLLSNKYY